MVKNYGPKRHKKTYWLPNYAHTFDSVIVVALKRLASADREIDAWDGPRVARSKLLDPYSALISWGFRNNMEQWSPKSRVGFFGSVFIRDTIWVELPKTHIWICTRNMIVFNCVTLFWRFWVFCYPKISQNIPKISQNIPNAIRKIEDGKKNKNRSRSRSPQRRSPPPKRDRPGTDSIRRYVPSNAPESIQIGGHPVKLPCW